jgi:hypothetical protein
MAPHIGVCREEPYGPSRREPLSLQVCDVAYYVDKCVTLNLAYK